MSRTAASSFRQLAVMEALHFAPQMGCSVDPSRTLQRGEWVQWLVEQASLQRIARRMSDHGKIMVALGKLCAEKAMAHMNCHKSRLGIFIGTGFGNITETLSCAEALFSNGSDSISPTVFANSVGNIGFLLGQTLQVESLNLSFSQEWHSFEAALFAAAQALTLGRIDCALVGAGDFLCGDPRDNLSRMDLQAQSLKLGEGAGFLFLTHANATLQTPKGYLTDAIYLPHKDPPWLFDEQWFGGALSHSNIPIEHQLAHIWGHCFTHGVCAISAYLNAPNQAPRAVCLSQANAYGLYAHSLWSRLL